MRQLESINIYAQGFGQQRAPGTSGADRASMATRQDQTARPVPYLDGDLRRQKADLRRRTSPTCSIPWLEEDSESWKQGYRYELGGESEESSEAMSAVVAKLPLSGFNHSGAVDRPVQLLPQDLHRAEHHSPRPDRGHRRTARLPLVSLVSSPFSD